MDLPPQVQALVNVVESLPGVVACFCSPKPLQGMEVEHLSLPGEFGDLPHALLRRSGGGRDMEVMIQVEIVFDRSSEAWLSLEFLAWWVRDWSRSGREIQMRPLALPPRAEVIQLGRTLKFVIESFVVEPEDSYQSTLDTCAEMAESMQSANWEYRDCFQHPAPFTGEVEDI